MFALIAVAMGSYANTTETRVSDDLDNCIVTVTHYDSQGNVTGTSVYSSFQPNLLSCQNYAHQVKKLYNMQ